ncbi:hypothetical protein, partial [Streptomyces spectabilis]|uniref:hypothetical protein n=1 Tax=Streptomyces spectabilis TaxID=68270 RepID=UPI0033D08AF2
SAPAPRRPGRRRSRHHRWRARPAGETLPPGSPGEVLVRGHHVMDHVPGGREPGVVSAMAPHLSH